MGFDYPQSHYDDQEAAQHQQNLAELAEIMQDQHHYVTDVDDYKDWESGLSPAHAQLYLNHPEEAKKAFEKHLTDYYGDPDDEDDDEPYGGYDSDKPEYDDYSPHSVLDKYPAEQPQGLGDKLKEVLPSALANNEHFIRAWNDHPDDPENFEELKSYHPQLADKLQAIYDEHHGLISGANDDDINTIKQEMGTGGGFDPQTFVDEYKKAYPNTTWGLKELGTPENAQKVLQGIIEEPERDGVGTLEDFDGDEHEYDKAVQEFEQGKIKAQQLLDKHFGQPGGDDELESADLGYGDEAYEADQNPEFPHLTQDGQDYSDGFKKYVQDKYGLEPDELFPKYGAGFSKDVQSAYKNSLDQQGAPQPGDIDPQHAALVAGIKKIFPQTPLDLDSMSTPELQAELQKWQEHLDPTVFAQHLPQLQALHDQHFGQGGQAAQEAEPLQDWEQQLLPQPQQQTKPDIAKAVADAGIFDPTMDSSQISNWAAKSPEQIEDDVAQLANGMSPTGFPLGNKDLQDKWKAVQQALYGDQSQAAPQQTSVDDVQDALGGNPWEAKPHDPNAYPGASFANYTGPKLGTWPGLLVDTKHPSGKYHLYPGAAAFLESKGYGPEEFKKLPYSEASGGQPSQFGLAKDFANLDHDQKAIYAEQEQQGHTGGGSSPGGGQGAGKPLTLDDWDKILPNYTGWFGGVMQGKTPEEQKEALQSIVDKKGTGHPLGAGAQKALDTWFGGQGIQQQAPFQPLKDTPQNTFTSEVPMPFMEGGYHAHAPYKWAPGAQAWLHEQGITSPQDVTYGKLEQLYEPWQQLDQGEKQKYIDQEAEGGPAQQQPAAKVTPTTEQLGRIIGDHTLAKNIISNGESQFWDNVEYVKDKIAQGDPEGYYGPNTPWGKIVKWVDQNGGQSGAHQSGPPADVKDQIVKHLTDVAGWSSTAFGIKIKNATPEEAIALLKGWAEGSYPEFKPLYEQLANQGGGVKELTPTSLPWTGCTSTMACPRIGTRTRLMSGMRSTRTKIPLCSPMPCRPGLRTTMATRLSTRAIRVTSVPSSSRWKAAPTRARQAVQDRGAQARGPSGLDRQQAPECCAVEGLHQVVGCHQDVPRAGAGAL